MSKQGSLHAKRAGVRRRAALCALGLIAGLPGWAGCSMGEPGCLPGEDTETCCIKAHPGQYERCGLPPPRQPPNPYLPPSALTPQERLKRKDFCQDFYERCIAVKRLGYPNLWMRVFIACIYVQSLALFPERARDAFSMLSEAERRVKRLPRNRRFRRQLLDGITDARRTAERQGLQPPEVGLHA